MNRAKTAFPWWVLVIVSAVSLGMGLSVRPMVAIGCLGLLALVVALVAPTQWIIGALVFSLFATRLVLDVGGLGVRPEHVMAVALFAHACVRSQPGAALRAMVHPAALWFGAFIAWSALISWFQAPNSMKSMLIVAWLASDWIILVAILALAPTPSELIRQGARCASIAAVVAIGLWLLGVAGLTTFGTQAVPGLAFRSAYGLSFEANILAGLLMVWAFIALTDRRYLSPRLRTATVTLCVVAATLAYTRAAFVGFVFGSLLWRLQAGKALRVPVGKLVVSTVAVVSIAVAFPQHSSPLVARAGQLLDFASGTGAQRVSISTTAINDIHGVDILLGLGTNSYGQRHRDPSFPDTPTPGYLANYPLQVFYDGGLIGSLLLLGAFSTVIPARGIRRRRALLVATVYLVSAIATSPSWLASTWYLFAIGASLKNEHFGAVVDEDLVKA